jgi:hypothetical protein
VAFPPPSQAPILRPVLQRTAEMASVMGDTWFGTPGGTGWASLRPPVTHETPVIRWPAVCLPLSVLAEEEGRADGRRL